MLNQVRVWLQQKFDCEKQLHQSEMVQNRINIGIQYRLPLDHDNLEIILAFSFA